MGGTFIAAQIGETGEVHNDEFDGTIPEVVTPEPWTLLLVGPGLFAIVVLGRRKRNSLIVNHFLAVVGSAGSVALTEGRVG